VSLSHSPDSRLRIGRCWLTIIFRAVQEAGELISRFRDHVRFDSARYLAQAQRVSSSAGTSEELRGLALKLCNTNGSIHCAEKKRYRKGTPANGLEKSDYCRESQLDMLLRSCGPKLSLNVTSELLSVFVTARTMTVRIAESNSDYPPM